jgi:hypothetical protein
MIAVHSVSSLETLKCFRNDLTYVEILNDKFCKLKSNFLTYQSYLSCFHINKSFAANIHHDF